MSEHEAGQFACPFCGEQNPDRATRCWSCRRAWSGSEDGTVGVDDVDEKDDEWSLELDPEKRYRIVGEIGEGGMGKVYRAYDRILKRYVAYKVLHPKDGVSPTQEMFQRFISEAQAAAQVEHPAIVPIHDMGTMADGRIWYTMKAVDGLTLKAHVARLRDGKPESGMTQFGLLRLFLNVMRAISYMHSRRLIHRDIKPQNIVIGKFGEIALLDFGLAKVLGPSIVATVRTEADAKTVMTTPVGTPNYMAPEQILNKDVNEASDQFALGAVLYEILTYRPPYVGHGHVMLKSIMTCDFPRPRDLAEIPEPLEAICLKAMAFAQADRYPSVGAMVQDLQDYLEGEKEQERRQELAAHYLEEAQIQIRRYRSFGEQASKLWAEAERIRSGMSDPPSRQERSQLRRAEMRAKAMTKQRESTWPSVFSKLFQAIDATPGQRKPRELMADLQMERMLEAEQAGDLLRLADHKAQVELYHDGRYAKELKGDGSVSFQTEPSGAQIYLSRYIEAEHRLVPDDERYLEATPSGRVELPMGSYLASLQHEDFPEVLFPFTVQRNEEVSVDIALLPPEELVDGFVYIPEGPYIAGGGGETPRSLQHLAGYCIGRNPITMAEYLVFIQDLYRSVGAAEAKARVPRVRPAGPYYWLETDQGWELIEGKDDEGHDWHPTLPVVSITAGDAEAYCAWRAKRDGVPFRLPIWAEWEKAARGADGRVYGWGNEWDPELCHSLGSGINQPERIGRETDVSPFGVLGLFGNVSDWTSSHHPRNIQNRMVLGGSFVSAEKTSSGAAESNFPANGLLSNVGFRLAYTPRLGANGSE